MSYHHHSRSQEWERVRSLEDVLALLASVEDRRRVIRAHAWREGDWEAVYAEATAMREELGRLKRVLSERWEELFCETQT